MKKLIICNNIYQTLVALWIVYNDTCKSDWDAIISDHMNESEEVAARIRNCELFENVFHVKSLQLTRNQAPRSSKIVRAVNAMFPMRELRTYVNVTSCYSDIYFSNFDNFSQLLYNALSHGKHDIRLHAYEEGLASYSSFAHFYLELKDYYGKNKPKLKTFIHRYIYKTKVIPGNLTEFLAFNPRLLQWDPECEIREMPKIDCRDERFKHIVNSVFQYEPGKNEYDRKYIFFEESFFADGSEVNDVALIEALAARVGKENVMIKIHPRNPVNRFKKLGFKTNQNTAIPWEVIVMNADDLSDKILVTVASSCILNPIIVFGKSVKAYSLFDCIDRIPPVLQHGYWELVEKVYKEYPNMIHRCKSIVEIV